MGRTAQRGARLLVGGRPSAQTGHDGTMPAPPLVLLDVDGVLNAVRPWGRTEVRSEARSDVWDDWRTGVAAADGRSFPITWSPTVVHAVLGWRELADVQWLTTWGHDANASLRHLLGLPELPVAGTYDDVDRPAGEPDAAGAAHAAVAPAAPDRLTGRWWKFDVVRRVVRTGEPRRLVWLDDDLAGQDDVRAWMREHTTSRLIAPDPRAGLTAAHLAAVEEFLRA